jgi:glycosyltransferase involved in cell wall biosynthesis
MINRSKADTVPGGDSTQLDMTLKYLRSAGIDVQKKLVGGITNKDWEVDLVHVFNIQTVEESWSAIREAKIRKLPVVLSPIFWRPYQFWYWQSAQDKRIWQTTRKIAGYALGERIYCAWQGLKSSHRADWKLQRCLLTTADMLLPNANIEYQEIRSAYRLNRHSILKHLVPNGIDAELFAKQPDPSRDLRMRIGDSKFVLQVGRISPEKNNLGLMKALWTEDLNIVFVGRASNEQNSYYQLCREAGAARGNVHFIDWVPYQELPSYYAAAAVHALPSWRDTPGLVSLEAAASGCQVVSTCIGSAREYFEENAWYCHPAYPDTIHKAVISALGDKKKESIRERILTCYSWERAAQETLKAYQRVLAIL